MKPEVNTVEPCLILDFVGFSQAADKNNVFKQTYQI